jgi:hypothetical protein
MMIAIARVVLVCALGTSPAALCAQASAPVNTQATAQASAQLGTQAGPQVSLTGPHWRVVTGHQFSTVVAYDTTRVTPVPRGRYDLWQRYTLHPPRVDPEGTVATILLRVVVDCAAKQTALRQAARYDKSGALIKQTAVFSAGENDFSDETPGSVEESALQTICLQLAARPPHP